MVEVSKNTVAVLLVLTIIVSILGTWTILSATNTQKQSAQPAPTTSKISLTVIKPSQPPSGQARISLNVIKPE
ncbi:MAG: hypothetical protein QXW00_02915 [Candidatus Woesearchaeota archaeon]